VSAVSPLRDALTPLSELAGVVAALVLTRDGLPVEMVGHGVRADVLAAEAGSLAEACRSAAERLLLGEAQGVSVMAPGYRLSCLLLDEHVLAMVLEGDAADAALAAGRDLLPELRRVLGVEAD
jgi:predicted regulator of Ras-like GTPase activity (Roadblock/LC7/MglB family)